MPRFDPDDPGPVIVELADILRKASGEYLMRLRGTDNQQGMAVFAVAIAMLLRDVEELAPGTKAAFDAAWASGNKKGDGEDA